MRLSTIFGAAGRAFRLTGLGIAGSYLLSANTYIAGAGVLLIAVGEGLDGAADYLNARGNGN